MMKVDLISPDLGQFCNALGMSVYLRNGHLVITPNHVVIPLQKRELIHSYRKVHISLLLHIAYKSVANVFYYQKLLK